MTRRNLVILTTLISVLLGMSAVSSIATAAPATSGFRALSGQEARDFRLPGDLELIRSFDLPTYGLTYERYQQKVGDASVLGGQLTLYRAPSGEVVNVTGAHYPGAQASNRVRLSSEQAEGRAHRDVGAADERGVELLLDPATSRHVYRVTSRQFDHLWVHLIDADSGAVASRHDGLMHPCDASTAPCGFGVQYDSTGGDGTLTDIKDLTQLSTLVDGTHELRTPLESAYRRQTTHDQGSSNRPFLGPIATDSDDVWTTTGGASPSQQALIDVQYYMNLTDDYLLGRHTFDWVALGDADPDHNIEGMVAHAHYKSGYVNAFWNGSYVAFGDGDQSSYEELTSLDVVAHELTHGVTDFTSNLVYKDESGALNEAFSDMLGNALEFYADLEQREPATTLEPDWLIGEDFDLRATESVKGFRNMADPEEDTDPDHYTERYTGTSDNGGVHTNSGIPNHAFYLLAEGGVNASCESPSSHNSAHCNDATDTQDNNLSVTAIGIEQAERIFFLAFTALSENATMCEARLASEAKATTLYGASSAELASTTAAWVAVGLTDQQCGLGDGGGTTGPTADFTFFCVGLTCEFTDTSTGASTWEWDFGDPTTTTDASNEPNPTYTYGAGGQYSVSLLVSDENDRWDDISKVVEVSSSTSSGITLTATGTKVKGRWATDLTWEGTNLDSGEDVTVHWIAGASSTGSYVTLDDGNDRHQTNFVGSGSLTYHICEADAGLCSNEVTVTF